MVAAYLLWVFGFIFGVLFLLEVGLILYKIHKKEEDFGKNIIIGVTCLILSFASISFNLFLGFNKIISSGVTYESISDSVMNVASDTAEKSANALKDVLDGVLEVVEDENE